jgi:hypothetical protein
VAGETRANRAIVPVGAAASPDATHAVVDVLGDYTGRP